MTEEQKLFLDKYEQSTIEYKKYYKFEIYNEKQIDIKVSLNDTIMKSYLVNQKILFISLYNQEDNENSRKIINYLLENKFFDGASIINTNNYITLKYNPLFLPDVYKNPDNVLISIDKVIKIFHKIKNELEQISKYGEIIDWDKIEKYIPMLINLSIENADKLQKLIEYLKKIQENSKNTTFKYNFKDIKSLNDVLFETNSQNKSIKEELETIVGLKEVKNHLKELENKILIDKLRKEKGLKINKRSLHTIFLGNPGTGKTTVARLLGKILKNYGILEKGHVVEVSRKDLVGKYNGQTAPQTFEKIKESFGGILFIDEAYSLINREDDSYGSESIDTILKAMEDYKDKFIVIVAGYPKPMQKFINANPGLSSRFTEKFNFEDYNVNELLEISKNMLDNSDYIFNEEAENNFEKLVNDIYEKRDENFGNARIIRNIIEDTIQNQNYRLSKELVVNNNKDFSIDLLKIIIKDDLDIQKFI